MWAQPRRSLESERDTEREKKKLPPISSIMMENEGLFEEDPQFCGSTTQTLNWNIKQESIEGEPTSVLDNRCSPSPPNSAFSLSTSSTTLSGGCGFGMESLEGLSFGDGSVLPCFTGRDLIQPSNPLLGFDNCGMDDFNLVQSCCSDLRSCDSVNGKFRVCDENPSCYDVPYLGGYNHLQLPFETPENRGIAGVIQVPKGSIFGENHEFLLRNEELLMGLPPQFVPPPLHLKNPVDINQQAMAAFRDQLVKISEMFQTGNFSLAQVILARLNQQFSLSGNPLLRTAIFHVKEELEKLLTMNGSLSSQPRSLSLLDIVDKMNAYKVFSETSPVMQFVDFTCTQALLEAFEDDDSIHILDFDIGCGSQWASFIRELPLRKKGAPSLKITAFASSSTHHPLELALVCGNIQEFANEFGVSLDLQVVNLDLFDLVSCKLPDFQHTKNGSLAVNFPISAFSHCPFVLCPVLSFVKQCSPKIMISFDRGCDRFDLSFPSHILHVLDSCSGMLESLHGSNVPADINKIEKFLIQPTIERAILGRIYSPDKMQANKAYQWKHLFTSVGFFPFLFSSFTESQADQVVRRTPVRGFQVAKQQASLVLSWMSRELVAASAWRC